MTVAEWIILAVMAAERIGMAIYEGKYGRRSFKKGKHRLLNMDRGALSYMKFNDLYFFLFSKTQNQVFCSCC